MSRKRETFGVRALYRSMLDESRYAYPRHGLMHHPTDWYLSDAPLARPVMGLYALAAFAETLLWNARYAKKGKHPPFDEVVKLFALTRRSLQNVLSTYKAGRRLPHSGVRKLRVLAGQVRDEARRVVSLAAAGQGATVALPISPPSAS